MSGAANVLLDVSELVHMPLRTGIQRVTRELMRHWHGPGRLVPCIHDPATDALRFLPDEAAAILVAGASGAELTLHAELDALRTILAREAPAPVPPGAGPILNVELFANPPRSRFYERLATEGRTDLFWLLYDFIPWLEPGWFPQFAARGLMPYLRAALRMPHLAFISEATRRDFRSRVARDPGAGGPVLLLGGDGLDLERQAFGPHRTRYVVLGSLEPRKRAVPVMEAFIRLWQAGSQARLTVIGRPMESGPREAELVASLAGEPRFTHLPNASDEAIRDQLRGARALLFTSAAEGFGLPPFEALFCGIPAIAAAGVPSLDALPPGGRIVLDDPAPDAIAAAVRSLEDDAAAARLWDEAASLPVPTWRDFAAGMAAWVNDPGGRR